jgi:hypothetical protein
MGGEGRKRDGSRGRQSREKLRTLIAKLWLYTLYPSHFFVVLPVDTILAAGLQLRKLNLHLHGVNI